MVYYAKPLGFLVILMSLILISVSQAAQKLILEETYDNLRLGSPVPNWKPLEPEKDPTIPVVQNTSFKSAPHGAKIVNDFEVLRSFNPLEGTVIIEIWMNPKLGADTNNILRIVLENEGGGSGLVGKNDSDRWFYTENGVPQFFKPVDGRGHDIKIVYSTTTATYDFFFDNNLIKANIAIGSAAENKRVVGITINSGRGGRGTSSYFDNLRVFSEVRSLTMTSLNPSRMAQGSANQNITILGDKFQLGAKVTFSGTGITVNSVIFNSTTQLTVNVSIASNAATGLRNITLTNPDGESVTATGAFTVITQSPPIAQVSSSVVNLGNVNKGSSGIATFTVTNFGVGTLSISNITSSNPQFTISPTNFNLSAGTSQTVTVTFRPTLVGWEKSILMIMHNASGSPDVVTANGIGRILPPTGSLSNTKIAFTSNRDGNNEIYVMNADGTNQTRLTNNPANEEFPSWSPDGTKIAFLSSRDGNNEIYVINADGTNQTRLTNNPASEEFPSWAPDGTKVAFKSDRDGNWEIYVMNADGTNQIQLTNNPAADYFPSWSPDGTKIAFTSNRDGNNEIYVMNVDGTKQTRLTNNLEGDIEPSWSPDGTKITFLSSRDGNGEIYVMNADGTNQTRLTNNLVSEGFPSWSPDGTKIAFKSDRDGNGEIYVMNADGTNQTRLTNNSAHDSILSWSSFFSIPILPHWDVTGDGVVDIFDLVLVGRTFGTTDPRGDVNGDGIVDIFDLVIIGNHFGEVTKPRVAPPIATKLQTLVKLSLISLINQDDSKLVQLQVKLEQFDRSVKLLGFQLDILFDSKLLQINEVTEGDVLKREGNSFWLKPQLTQGRISNIASVLILQSPNQHYNSIFSESEAIVAIVTFKLQGDLFSAADSIKLVNLKLSDRFGYLIGFKLFEYVELQRSIAAKNALLQNYPNPFNPETWIPYQLANSADVMIRIYDVTGRIVRTLSLGKKEAGIYVTKGRAAYWDGKNNASEYVSSGVYFYELSAGNFRSVKKMLILK